MHLHAYALVLMAWPAMSYAKDPFDRTNAITSNDSETTHNDESTKVWDSWEEEMEEALRNLDIELKKVAQKRILDESQTQMEEDYFEEDASMQNDFEEDASMQNDGYEDDNGRFLHQYVPKSKEECEKFERTFTSDDDVHFHTPDGCVGWEIDHVHTTCDKLRGEFPITCTFYQNLTDTNAADEVMRQLAFNEPKMEVDEILEKEEESLSRNLKKGRKLTNAQQCEEEKKKRKKKKKKRGNRKKRGKTTKQQQWFSKAAKLQSEGEDEGSCSPAYQGRDVRGIDCDLCWAWWIPYPCNCNCRGWTQILVSCWKPCSHYNNEYTEAVGFHCWKPCDREGQIALNVGCGLTPLDRTCHASTGDCIMKYVNHVVSILDVLTSILSGGVAGAFKSAIKTAAKAGSKALAKTGLRSALKAAAKEFAKKLLKNKAIKKKIAKYKTHMKKELKNQVSEQGSELFLAASMKAEPDWGGMALEIAEALDPSGFVGLVRGFIPPESCDESVYMDEDIPDEESDLPDLDPLDTIDDTINVAKGKTTSQSSTYHAYAVSQRAVDGNTDGNWGGNSVACTNHQYKPWWEVDLELSYSIDSINVYNRKDCCAERLSNFDVIITNHGVETWRYQKHGSASETTYIDVPANIQGNKVKVQLRGTNYLTLAEVEVFAPAINVAKGKTTSQSSTYHAYAVSQRAVDGNTDGNWGGNSVACTSYEIQPWWEVDLGFSYSIDSINVYNRKDCCAERLSNFDVIITNHGVETWRYHEYCTASETTYIDVPANIQGNKVKVQLRGKNYLTLAEVEVFA